jgi:glutathione synthase/RimK-type ligase-like ATP-grasp enzyme
MIRLIIVVDQITDWSPYYPTEHLVAAEAYLAGPSGFDASQALVVNLCQDYAYLSTGYYCSLLAEARGHRVIPSVSTLNDLQTPLLFGLDRKAVSKAVKKVIARDPSNDENRYDFLFYFGQTDITEFEDISHTIFNFFPCPITRATFARSSDKDGTWALRSIHPVTLDQLSPEEETGFANAFANFSSKLWRKPRIRPKFKHDMAMLIKPDEKMPPSNRQALVKFRQAGRRFGINVETITQQDWVRLAEYDALFIRQTTAINDETYQFAKQAELEGLVVMDDPNSIMRCTNKVYLAELLNKKKIASPRSLILNARQLENLPEIVSPLGFPTVLKIPDGSFSRGVVKASNEKELIQKATELFAQSKLIIAQEFVKTEYDWRIGVLNRKPIFACQYFMTRGHWQIYKHTASGRVAEGDFTTMLTEEAPREVLKVAMKAANLIGDGLYGVDLKQSGDRVMVIEVNDNPNVDAGVEDLALGDGLYDIIMEEFLRRIEGR